MVIKKFQRIIKRYFKRYLRITIISLILAAIVTLAIGSTGNPSRPSIVPKSIDLPVILLVFLRNFAVIFGLRLVLLAVQRNYSKLQRVWENFIRDPLHKIWEKASRKIQAVMIGFVIAAIAAAITAAIGYSYAIPTSVISGVFVFVWPIGTYVALTTLTSKSNSTSATSSLLVSSRYAELRQLETRAIAALFAFVIAAVAGVVLWFIGAGITNLLFICGVIWLVATMGVYKRYETTMEIRSDLTIVSIENATSTEQIELSVTNQGDRTVELTNATIRDTHFDLYQLATNITLHPGSCYTFKLPSDFSLSPSDDERTLPLGYTLYRGQQYPVVYSQDGFAFKLHRDHTETRQAEGWTENASQFDSQSSGVPNAASSQDN